MGGTASQITSLAIVYSTVYTGVDQRKHQSSSSLAFVRGIHRLPVNSPQKWPVTRKLFPFGDVMICRICRCWSSNEFPRLDYVTEYQGSIHSHCTLRPRQNGHLFADDTFKRIFLNENIRISIKISLKFVPNGLINNIPALVLIMAWRRPGGKPLSEPMMIRSLTHICITQAQWVKQPAPLCCQLDVSEINISLLHIENCHWS